MNTKVMFSSNHDEWATPDDFFNQLNKEFNFTLDPCCTKQNHKCDKYFTLEDDGLSQDWSGETVFCNPPYSQIAQWVKKAWKEGRKEPLWCCLFQHVQTQSIFTITFITDQKLDLLKVV